jgi:hypothetical protein
MCPCTPYAEGLGQQRESEESNVVVLAVELLFCGDQSQDPPEHGDQLPRDGDQRERHQERREGLTRGIVDFLAIIF